MSSVTNKIKRGSFTGSGADRKVLCGFKPRVVHVYNITDGVDYKKTETMEDSKARKEVIAGDKTYVDSIEIESNGFTIIAAENVADKVFHYAAYESQSE